VAVLFGIDKFDRLYRSNKRASGDGSADVRISLRPVSAKKLRVLTHVAVENQTNTTTRIRLGIHNRGEDYYLDELKDVLIAELCVSRSDILLGDGDSFFVEFTGSHDPDILLVTCLGWEQALK